MPSVFGRAGAPGKRSLTNCAKVCGVTSRILRLLVELDAMRMARPVRRRLAGVILGIIAFQVNPGVLSDAFVGVPWTPGDRDRPDFMNEFGP